MIPRKKKSNIVTLPRDMTQEQFTAWLTERKLTVAGNHRLPSDLVQLSEITDIGGCIVMFARNTTLPDIYTGKGEPDHDSPVLSRQSIGRIGRAFFWDGHKLPKGQKVLVDV